MKNNFSQQITLPGRFHLYLLVFSLILIVLILVNSYAQKQNTASNAASVCKNITDKKQCNADPCCDWSGIMDECKKRETCGGNTARCTNNNPCKVSEPNNSCDVSISPASIPYGGYARVRLSVKPTACTGRVAVDPFVILDLPKGIKKVSGFTSNQQGWGSLYYLLTNNFTFDNMNLSFGNGWYVEFTVKNNRRSGELIGGQSWIDLNQTCQTGRRIQLRQSSCSTSFTVN